MKTTTLALAAVMAAGTLAHAQEAVQWRVEDGGNGHWYQGVPTTSGLTLATAVAIAESIGGYPVTITSSAESALVTELSNHDSLWPSFLVGPLIGLFVDDADCMPGCWVTGERFDFTNWHPGNPDFLATEHCVFLFDRNARRWQNHLCGTGFQNATPASMIVEWSADCNGDGIVDYGQILDGTFADANGNGVPDCCDEGVSCDPCLGDVNFDGIVNGADISVLLGFWGLNGKPVAADINQDGQVDGTDLANVLGSWGECP